jgi:hypothetical protein
MGDRVNIVESEIQECTPGHLSRICLGRGNRQGGKRPLVAPCYAATVGWRSITGDLADQLVHSFIDALGGKGAGRRWSVGSPLAW